mgnify:CR=1 FL=1
MNKNIRLLCTGRIAKDTPQRDIPVQEGKNTKWAVCNPKDLAEFSAVGYGFGKELQEQLEAIQVEFNNKLQEYQNATGTMTDAVRQLKEKELTDLNTRIQEFQQVAQQDLQKKENELLAPIYEKVKNTIDEVAKAGGYTVIFETGSMIYFDEAQVKDITPEVKAKLGAQ